MNKVIAGKYEGKSIISTSGRVFISIGVFSPLELTNDIITSYEVLNGEQRKSAKSGIARGLVGGALFGGVGALAGGLSAKSKGKYQIALEFYDGEKSLLEVDDKIYKLIMKALF